jgi:hypothetical protein
MVIYIFKGESKKQYIYIYSFKIEVLLSFSRNLHYYKFLRSKAVNRITNSSLLINAQRILTEHNYGRLPVMKSILKPIDNGFYILKTPFYVVYVVL